MINFGTGARLCDAIPELRDAHKRRELILDVVERNSVIEGLQPFDEATRERLLDVLRAMDENEQASPEPATPSADST